MEQHIEKYDKKKVRLISLTSFLYGFSLSLSIYILSLYYKEVVGEEKVGVFFLIEYIILLVLLLNLHHLIKKTSKSFATIFMMFARAILALGLYFFWTTPNVVGSFVLMSYIIFGSLASVSLDIMLESFSTDNMSGRIRGLYLTVVNAGFILGPYYSMKIYSEHGFSAVFKAMFLVDLLIFFISYLGLRGVNHSHLRTNTILDVLKSVLAKKDIMRIYFISFVLDFFYATMIIYSLIYMRDIGFSGDEISKIFTIMLLPFVLLQYPIGVLADKMNEKKMILLSLIIISYSTATIFFLDFKSFVLWTIILFATRVGAAMLEILRDSYFYKRIDGDDVGLIDFFRTTRSIGYIIFSVISLILLIFFPTKSVFLLLSLVAFLGTYAATRLGRD